MATCVRCKREIDATLKYCPYCGAKQNMFIDINQVVTKSLIDGKFDASKDIKKAPRVEIIIDDSEAATPVFPQTKDGKEVGRIEELPTPDIKEADISEYNDNIEIVMPKDVTERLNKVTSEEAVEAEEEKKDIFEKISESADEAYSRKLNIFNTIFNLITNIICLFLVGFVYFYQTSNMLIIDILKDIKHNMIDIAHLGYEEYASILGVVSLVIALVFLIVYIIRIIITAKKPCKHVGNHYYFGISMAFIISTLFFNTAFGKFKIDQFNYFFRIHSYLIMGLMVINFIINWACRCLDPYTLSFRWGFNRYYLENKEKLPKLNGMTSSISRRKIAYLLIIALVLFGIYLDYLLSIFITSYKQASAIIDYNFKLSMYSNYFSRYVEYKSQFDGLFNIFKIIAPTMELFYINGYGTYTVMLFVMIMLTSICIIAREYMGRRKEKVISKVSSIIYIVSLITFMILMFRSAFTLLSILDGAGVNENVPPLIRNTIIAQIGTYLLCFIIMILDRCLNKNIMRKQMSVYRED